MPLFNRRFGKKTEYEWFNKGLALLNTGHIKKAMKCFDNVIAINPRRYDAWTYKGSALASLDMFEEAIFCHERALTINPRDEHVWCNKGFTLAHLSAFEEAIACFDKALEITPKNEETWGYKGLALINLVRSEEAILCFDKALEINPRLESSWDSKGVALSSLGRFEEAIACFDKALEIKPENEEIKRNRDYALKLQSKSNYVTEKTTREVFLNDRYGVSIKYPKNWVLDILEPKPEFTVELNVWFGIPGKVACSIMVGPIGGTIYGRTQKELENRARIHRQNLNANLLSSKRLTISGIDAYEHVYSAKYPTRYAKQVGLFKDNDEYLLLFKVFSEEDFEKYASTFDECIQSFNFKK